MKKYALLFITIFFIPFLLTGCESDEDNENAEALRDKPLRINLATEPPTLDWSLARDYTSITVIINIMEGLTKFGPDFAPAPSLAESWDISDDNKTIVFHLRKGVKWSDGKPLTAHDFVYSWKRLLKPETGADYAYFLYDVEGAKEYNTGKVKTPDSIGIKAIDDHTFEVRLKAPASYFLSLMTFVSTFPLREDLIEKHGMKWTKPENIAAIGPFKLADWRHHERLTLVKNHAYWGKPPKLDKVEMIMSGNPSSSLALYESGELDFLDGKDVPTLEVPRLRSSEDFRVKPVFRGNYIGFNVTKPPFDNVLVRKAFSAAIDRKSMVDLLQGAGIPTTSWIPKGMLGYDPNIGIDFDPSEARKWLAEAGYPGGKGLPEITFLYPDVGSNRLIAVALQSMWKKHLGAKLRLNNQEWKVYLSTLNVDPPQIFRGGWGADFPDPHNFMNLFECDTGNNHTRWCSKEYDSLIDAAAREIDPVKRVPIYNEAQKLLTESDVAIAPFFISIQYSMIKPYVKGLDINELSLIFLDKVYIENRPAQ